MTTTRYAIEKKPGVWRTHNGSSDFDEVILHDAIEAAIEVMEMMKPTYPQARIVPVKCEVVDE